MTTSKAAERARGGPVASTVIAALRDALTSRLLVLGVTPETWPLVQYQADPLSFFRDVLGVGLMAEQEEIALSVRDNVRTAVSGGRKVGKDFVLACIALWFYCCFPGARVRFTAVKLEQVDDIFWLQTRQIIAGHGRCVRCKKSNRGGPRPCEHSMLMPEEAALGARTGLHPPKASQDRGDFRELVGYTAKEAEGAAGISAGNQLYIVDEASAVEDKLLDAIEGNLGGSLGPGVCGRIALISNPTRREGQFFRAFHSEAEQWRTFFRSSADVARKYAGKFPGVATLEWVRSMYGKYGKDSDFVRIHVEGRFVEHAAGMIFDVPFIQAAIDRWESTEAEGPTRIGLDVAGESGKGDASTFAVRRGRKLLELYGRRGLSPDAHVAELAALCRKHPCPDPADRPTVIYDRGGEPGRDVRRALLDFLEREWRDPPFDVVGVDSSKKAQRDPTAYALVRDELVANLAYWLRDVEHGGQGGAIPDDPQLATELNAFRWVEQRIANVNKLVDKSVMREKLGRSPDKADALALSCWAETHWRPETAEAPAAQVERAPREEHGPFPEATIDPYGSADWSRGA